MCEGTVVACACSSEAGHFQGLLSPGGTAEQRTPDSLRDLDSEERGRKRYIVSSFDLCSCAQVSAHKCADIPTPCMHKDYFYVSSTYAML